MMRTRKPQYSDYLEGTDRIFNNMIEGREEFLRVLGPE
jgi:hypothetical protein